MKRSSLLALFLVGCGPCRGCQPELPDTDGQDTDTDTDPTVVDTAPPAACTLPEEEPNNALSQAQELPLEVQACGELSPAPDFDNWRFTVPGAMWLGVYAHSTSIGSRSDVGLVLIRDDDESIEVHDRDDGEQDVELVFPATAAGFTALIVDDNNLGGPDDYFYELLVGEAKAPVTYNLVEVDADAPEDAQTLADEDVVMGFIDEAHDVDWYRLPIPASMRSVEMWVEARQHGSAATLRVQVYDDPEGTPFATLVGSSDGTSDDPDDELPTEGDAVWYLRVSAPSGQGGFAHWYTLAVDLKGEE